MSLSFHPQNVKYVIALGALVGVGVAIYLIHRDMANLQMEVRALRHRPASASPRFYDDLKEWAELSGVVRRLPPGPSSSSGSSSNSFAGVKMPQEPLKSDPPPQSQPQQQPQPQPQPRHVRFAQPESSSTVVFESSAPPAKTNKGKEPIPRPSTSKHAEQEITDYWKQVLDRSPTAPPESPPPRSQT